VVFGLWRVYFPPCLVRPGRRMPVQGLSEGSRGFRDSYPRRGPGVCECLFLRTPGRVFIFKDTRQPRLIEAMRQPERAKEEKK